MLTYGCVLRSLKVPSADGTMTDVVLGYDDVHDYETRSGRMGAVIGRFANRIRGGSFSIDGRPYQLTKNRGENHIHGGNKGFDKRIWHIEEVSGDHVRMSLFSPDWDEGYPGNMEAEVTYALGDGRLSIEYRAVSDADTICNLTNHSYFNLGGNGTVEDHSVLLHAGRYIPLDKDGIPVGAIMPVDGTCYDLRRPSKMADMFGRFGGYDCCIIPDGDGMRRIADVSCSRTGISMSVDSDMPTVQFYTAEGLRETVGKDGTEYGKRSGLCLETEFCPNAPNTEGADDAVLRKEGEYRHETVFAFDNLDSKT